MKKIALVVIAAASLSGCSWFKQSSDWADRTFFDSNNPNPNPGGQPGTNYPYYYTSASPIDANEKAAYNSPYPPAAPGAINNNYGTATYSAYGQPQYAPNPSSPQALTGGYGTDPNAPSVNVQFGSKGTDVSSAKTGDYIKNPQPKLPPKIETRMPAQQAQQLPPLQGTQGQYQPQYGYPQQAPQPPIPPMIAPAMPPAPAQPAPYGYAPQQPAPQVYGQPQYAPQGYPPAAPYSQPQYQYPPQPYSNPYPYSPNK